jgi:transcriptional regulator with XRE-family HTH domain
MTTSMGNPRGRGPVDQVTRDRVRAWIRYEMDRRQITSARDMARKIGVNHAYLSIVLNGTGTAGLELVLRLNRKLHMSLDAMLNDDPPKEDERR